MKQKKKQTTQPLDLEHCEKLAHLSQIPKSRSSSITSIESDGSIVQMLKPPPVKTFDELTSFEAYLRDETWDNDYDYCHAHLTYYPPFIMKEIHGDPEKIKETMNKNSSKFVRHLKQHIKKHLMADMEKCSGYKMDFKETGKQETPDKLSWVFLDDGNHGFSEEEEKEFNRWWKVQLEVSCNNQNPLVEIDYMAIPV